MSINVRFAFPLCRYYSHDTFRFVKRSHVLPHIVALGMLIASSIDGENLSLIVCLNDNMHRFEIRLCYKAKYENGTWIHNANTEILYIITDGMIKICRRDGMRYTEAITAMNVPVHLADPDCSQKLRAILKENEWAI